MIMFTTIHTRKISQIWLKVELANYFLKMEPSKPKLSQTTLGLQQPSKQCKRGPGGVSKGSSRSDLILLWLRNDVSTSVGDRKVVGRW